MPFGTAQPAGAQKAKGRFILVWRSGLGRRSTRWLRPFSALLADVDDALNVLIFGPGIRPEDLRYSEQNGDLVIEFANQPGDR